MKSKYFARFERPDGKRFEYEVVAEDYETAENYVEYLSKKFNWLIIYLA